MVESCWAYRPCSAYLVWNYGVKIIGGQAQYRIVRLVSPSRRCFCRAYNTLYFATQSRVPKGAPWETPPSVSWLRLFPRVQKRDHQLPTDRPSFVVTFRLPTACYKCSSILPYWVSAFWRRGKMARVSNE